MRQLCLIIVMLAACSHDARRENPLDPIRFPAVTLREPRPNKDEATVFITWSTYEGSSSFAAYTVLRREGTADAWDTLATLTAESDTLFLHRSVTPGIHHYNVSVTTAEGVHVPSNTESITLLAGHPQLRLQFDDEAGTIQVTWNAIRGGVSGYELRRTDTTTGETLIVYRSDDPLDTLFVDAGVRPSTPYEYQVLALSAVQTLSDPVAAAVHEFFGSWSTASACNQIAIDGEDVLYLVSSGSPVLYQYSVDGVLLNEIVLDVPDGFRIRDLAADDSGVYILYDRNVGTLFAQEPRVAFVVALDDAGGVRYQWPPEGVRPELTSLAVDDGSLWVAQVLSIHRGQMLQLSALSGSLIDSTVLERAPDWGLDVKDGEAAAVFGASDGGAGVFSPIEGGVPSRRHRTTLIVSSRSTPAMPIEEYEVNQLARDLALSSEGPLYALYTSSLQAPRVENNFVKAILENTPHVEVMDGPELRESWGRSGDTPGRLDFPVGIVLDSDDRVYILDRDGAAGGTRVQVFAP
ncbi:MAG: hypothetical protein HOB49_01945 [Gemmatimonadetes bacterium]|jgi:hypothetical protein|nr:hypothetical protein [Gemmatimonadota bacterium]MBT5142326.1 hypothetical protein [Gemmatimonadota bacterium]MBT6625733.1 hypothetical protein [Gemmatimonadota bacterium]